MATRTNEFTEAYLKHVTAARSEVSDLAKRMYDAEPPAVALKGDAAAVGAASPGIRRLAEEIEQFDHTALAKLREAHEALDSAANLTRKMVDLTGNH